MSSFCIAVKPAAMAGQYCEMSADDAEQIQVGRQAKAGCNPFTIQIAGPEFLQATKVTEEDLGCERSVGS